MPRKNIILIGMPGAGKSTVGPGLAENLEMSFVDTDLLIREKEGRPLQGIIDEKGEEEFLKIEENVILSLQAENCVIATGGSAVYGAAAVKHLQGNGMIVYLKIGYDELKKRIDNLASRGIVMKKGQKLIDLYRERVVLYEKYADITVDCSKMKIKETIQKIKEAADKIIF